jgi:hypothetical protein
MKNSWIYIVLVLILIMWYMRSGSGFTYSNIQNKGPELDTLKGPGAIGY